MTHYETLGVAETATAEEIKKAYRRLASQHHPDRGGDTAKFQAIQSAYDVVSDPQRREQYDLERRGGGPNIHFQWNNGHPDISDIFRQFGFGGGDPFGQFRQHQRRNKDLRIEIPIPLVTTLEEQTKIVSVQTTNGQRETVEVRIPRGVTNGTNIKYANLGDNLFNTIPRGDLYVQINVHNAENYVVQGIDLHTRINVNCFIATAGGTATVTGLDGKMFLINIPAGTQPGLKFRIPEQGLYQLNSTVRGDLYAEIAISIPQNLSTEQLEIVKSLIN